MDGLGGLVHVVLVPCLSQIEALDNVDLQSGAPGGMAGLGFLRDEALGEMEGHSLRRGAPGGMAGLDSLRGDALGEMPGLDSRRREAPGGMAGLESLRRVVLGGTAGLDSMMVRAGVSCSQTDEAVALHSRSPQIRAPDACPRVEVALLRPLAGGIFAARRTWEQEEEGDHIPDADH